MKTKILFAVANGILILCFVLMLVLPKITSIRAGLTSLELISRRSAVESAQSYETDIQNLPAIYYNSMAYALGDVYQLSHKHDLTQIEFVVFEPVDVGTHQSLYEVRVRAGYEGSLGDVARFVNELNNGVPIVESFGITVGSVARLTIEIMFVTLD